MENKYILKLSVILPSLNVGKYIEKCIQSVLAQSLEEIEIICVDAGSVDETQNIIKKYCALNSNVHFILSPLKSYGAQVNRGIKEAKGKYIAIVETDDFIQDNTVYETFYQYAESNQLDVCKGDFILCNEYDGFEVLNTYTMFSDSENFYEKVVNAETCHEIVARDNNVWRGIYNRSFLIKNNILFHETLGAAYQDIGFLHLVCNHAKRMMYLRKPFYMYRYGISTQSFFAQSSFNFNILKYVCQEYKWLLEEKEFKPEEWYVPLFYKRMAVSFLGEYKRLIEMEEFNTESQNIKPYYEWFCDTLLKVKSEGCFDGVSTDNPNSGGIECLLQSDKQFATDIQVKYKIKQSKIELLRGKGIILFSAGNIGKKIVPEYHRLGLSIYGFCDNSSEMWGRDIYIWKVFNLESCLKSFPNASYIITTKKYEKEIHEQLLMCGVSEDSIFLYETMVEPFM